MAKKKNNPDDSISQTKPESIKSDLDPHLQELMLKVREGKTIDPTFAQESADGTIIVDVIAKVNQPEREVPGLNVVKRIGQIVTGTVNVEDIERVRENPNIISLKRASKLHPQLGFSLAEMNASAEQLEAEFSGSIGTPSGAGVVVGIIDYGCDFRHTNFRHADGTTRLLFLWDQTGGQSALSPAGFNYGREFTAAKINQSLQQSNPYTSLLYRPGASSHGTHVMDIAAGNGNATQRPGVAPEANLIFVNIAHDDIQVDELSGESVNFGNSKMLLEAAAYIFEKAEALGRQAVINISLGTNGGPHDGSTLAEQGFDTLLETAGRAIVIAAGNSWTDRTHAQGTVVSGTPRTLTWVISPTDQTTNEMEIWYPGTAALTATLTTPSGTQFSAVPLGSTVSLTNSAGQSVGRVIHRADDPNNHDNHLDIVFDPSVPAGSWKIVLQTTSTNAVPFHAWIERDDFGQSQFAADDDDRTFTIGSISCGRRTIAVGSYITAEPGNPLSPFSSEGPTRDGRHKPEVSAPGQHLHPFETQGILAARSESQGAVRKSGTSMAAPHVTGLIALLMQSSSAPLTNDEIRTALSETARLNPPPGTDWHPRYGHGRVDGVSAIASHLGSSPQPLAHTSSNGSPPSVSSVSPVGALLSAVAMAAQQSKTRFKISVEIEPAT